MSMANLSQVRPRAPGYASLDVWRGVAALMVVVYHATATFRGQDFQVGSLAAGCVQVLNQFWLGVQIFFVISGYCITAAADSARRKSSSVKTFAVRRILRIYPTFILWALLMALVIAAAQHFMPDAPYWNRKDNFTRISEFTWMDWLSNLALVHTWLPGLAGFEPHTLTVVSWTLCYEVQFYFVCGVFLALAPRRYFLAVAIYSALVAVLFLVEPGHSTRAPLRGLVFDARWLQFAMGIGVYYVLNYGSRTAQLGYVAGLMGLAIVCGIARGASPSHVDIAFFRKSMVEQMCCAGFATVLVALRAYDGVLNGKRWLAPLAACGVFSYSLYLVHWPFCKVISTVFWNVKVRSLAATLGITTPVCVLVSIIAAWVYFRLVERRFVNAQSPRQAVVVVPLAQATQSS